MTTKCWSFTAENLIRNTAGDINELFLFPRKSDSKFKQYAAVISRNCASLQTLAVCRNFWLNRAHHTAAHTHTIHTSGSYRDLTTRAWGCLTLENNGMSSWLCSRAWRVYSTGLGVSNVARLHGRDPALGGTAGSLLLAARPFQTAAGSWIIWAAHRRVMSTLGRLVLLLLWCFCRDVMIKCVNTSCGEFISRSLVRGVALSLCFAAADLHHVFTFHPSSKKNLPDFYHAREFASQLL